jgi:O-antigen/teichoic acid export membrane protein
VRSRGAKWWLPSGLRGRLPSWGRDWAADSSFLLLSQVLTVTLTSVVAIVIARGLDPAEWGTFSAFLSLGLAVSIFVDFGMGTWLLRELSKLWANEEIDPAEARARASWLSTHAVLVSGAIGAASVCFAVVFTLVRGHASLTLIAAGLLAYGALLGAANGLEAYLRSRRKLRLLVAFTLTEKALLVALVVVVELAGLGVSWIALAYVIAGTVRLSLVSFTVFAGGHLSFVRPRWASLREIAAGSFPFALNTASLNIIPRLDSFVLLTLSATSAGYFATGERALGPALLVPVALSATLYPFLSREARGERSVRLFAALFATVGLALAVVGALLTPVLVPWIFGEQYRSSIIVVQIMLFVLPFCYASNALLPYLYLQGREFILLRVTIFASLLGTVAMVAGQLLRGPALAATGFVLRQVVILVALVLLEIGVARSHRPSDVVGRGAAVPGENR